MASTSKAKRQSTPEASVKAGNPSAKPFRFGFLVHDVSRMRRTLFDVRMKPLGITRSQWSVLAALSLRPDEGVMQVDLAREMDVGKVTIGGLIQRLEKIGYVRREVDARDLRVRRVFITAEGFEIIRQMEQLGGDHNARTLAGISQTDLKIAEDVLAKVKANIRAELETLGNSTSKARG